MQLDLTRKLLILGCGGHSKVSTETAEAIGFSDICYMDIYGTNNIFLGKKVYRQINENYCDYFFVAIGDNFLREKAYYEFLKNNPNVHCPALIHPSSCLSPRCSINDGTLVMPLCVINSEANIGVGVIINTSSIVEHNSQLMDFSSIAPGVKMGGNVTIGTRSAISIGANVANGISIGEDVVVGGSSFVLNDLKNNCIAYGTPAKFVRFRKSGEKYL